MSIAKAYREANQKTVEVDGFEWQIRKIPPLILEDLMELTGVEITAKPMKPKDVAKLGKKVRPKIFGIMKTVFPVCVVKPKISLNPGSEDELSINDLSTTTSFGLLDEIYRFSGLTAEAFSKRKKFRKEPSGKASRNDKPASKPT